MSKKKELAISEQRVGVSVMPECTEETYFIQKKLDELVRDAMIQGGLGRSSMAAPLADIVATGEVVLLKPNWVFHKNKAGHGMACMVTQPEFVEAIIRQLVLAEPGKIIIADAPIQGADFDSIVPHEWRKRVKALARKIPIEFIDFRRVIWSPGLLRPSLRKTQRSERDYSLFDLGSDSVLESISIPSGRFRNTCYDHRALEKTHRSGCHKYLICREMFTADTVINLPKLKSHRKTGMTGALKNLVGMNGDKDYLPHHRVGGTDDGGDCYPGNWPLKALSERITDLANQRVESLAYKPIGRLADLARRMHKVIHGEDEIDGGWHGNDTTWRMVTDLNRIAIYGDEHGRMNDEPQRRIFSITDAIVAGQGEGPLSPEPISLGAVTFATNSVFADIAHAALMRFDIQKLPLLRESFHLKKWRLTKHERSEFVAFVHDEKLSQRELSKSYGKSFKTPLHWLGKIEAK